MIRAALFSIFPVLASLVETFVGGAAAKLLLELVLSGGLAAGRNSQVHSRRRIQAKGLGAASEVKLVNVKNVSLAVRRVRLQVAAVAVARCLVQVEVFVDQLHKLLLDVCQFCGRHLELLRLYFFLFKEPNETQLVLQQEEQGFSAALGATACPAHAVDVVVGVIWGVVLDHPVDLGEVESSLGHISAQENARFCLTELKVRAGAFLLLLLAVNVFDGDVYVVEQIRVKLNSVALTHEHHHFLLQIFAQESKQELEFARGLAHHVSLLQRHIRARLRLLGDFNQHWVLETKTAQVLHFLGHRGGEKTGNTGGLGKQLNDFVHLFLETDFKNCVSLVDDQHLQIV